VALIFGAFFTTRLCYFSYSFAFCAASIFSLCLSMLISLRRSTVVKPGQPVSVIPQGDLVITNAALGTQLADSTGRTSVKLTYPCPVKATSDDEGEEEQTIMAHVAPSFQCHGNLCLSHPDKTRRNNMLSLLGSQGPCRSHE
jgi:Nucleoplasmin-like domain